MIHYTLEKIAQITNGTVIGNKNIVVNGIDKDSRTISNDILFVPIVGARADGHIFVKELFDKGLNASLWQKDNPNPIPNGNIVVVDNVLQALYDLTSFYRNELKTILIAVTGSSGKTSTKDIIYSVLSRKEKTFKTFGNQNNEIGIPLTLLNCPDDCKYGIVEIGISDFNEMEPMAKIVRPDFTVIVSIGPAHIGQFKTIDNIVAEKCKINSYLNDDAICFYNAESYGLTKQLYKMGLEKQIIGYGLSDCDAIAKNISYSDSGTKFEYDNFSYNIPILGKHFVLNAMSAIVLAKHFGYDNGTIQSGLNSISITEHRMQLIKIGQCTIIDDAYNANPSSMVASLRALEDYHCEEKKIVVLGDMLELGENSNELHRSISKEINFKNFDRIYLVGSEMKNLQIELSNYKINSKHYENTDQLIDDLKGYLNNKNVMLFKASKGMKFVELINQLKEEI